MLLADLFHLCEGNLSRHVTSAHVQPVLQDVLYNFCRIACHNLQDFVRSMWLFLCFEVVNLSYGISDIIEIVNTSRLCM